MHYLDAFECEFYDDIENLINTYVEIHHASASNNCINTSVFSCNSFFTVFDPNQHENKSNTKIQNNQLDCTKLQPYASLILLTSSKIILRALVNMVKPLRLKSF